MCFAPQRRALFRHSNVRSWCALYILTSKCALRHNGVHFFDIATSKSGPELVCFVHFYLELCLAPQRRALFHSATSKSAPNMWWFVHFDFEMCFAPQRAALFRHCNFQRWSGAGVFCTFWLGTVLRATTACTFSTSQLLKVLRTWCALYILTWKCASATTAYLASWLRTRRFSKPTFQPSGASNHINHSGKTQCFATFLPFREPAFLLTLSLLFYLSIYLPISLSLSLSLYLFVCLSVYLSVYLQA